jgi:F-type H+-transporting ATPase subunit delta
MRFDLPDVLSSYRERLLEKRGIAGAEVISANPLTARQLDAIARQLGSMTGRTIRIDARTDPSIIGGVIAKVGSTVYDGSAGGQLARLREHLKRAA